jgi:hypothetical protein
MPSQNPRKVHDKTLDVLSDLFARQNCALAQGSLAFRLTWVNVHKGPRRATPSRIGEKGDRCHLAAAVEEGMNKIILPS